MKYAFMRENREEFELKHMCRVLQVSRSGYYDWQGEESLSAPKRTVLCSRRFVRFIRRPKRAYGATKTWQALKQSGMACGKHRVARLRRQAGTLDIRCSRSRWLCYG